MPLCPEEADLLELGFFVNIIHSLHPRSLFHYLPYYMVIISCLVCVEVMFVVHVCGSILIQFALDHLLSISSSWRLLRHTCLLQ